MQEDTGGSLAAITEANTREALRALRFAKSLASSPLIRLSLVDGALATEGLDDTSEVRAWLLHRIVDETSLAALARARGVDRIDSAQMAAEPFLGAMPLDFRVDDIDRESWSMLCLRHVADARIANADLARMLGVTPRTAIRRLGRGYALLAAQLRERELEALRKRSANESRHETQAGLAADRIEAGPTGALAGASSTLSESPGEQIPQGNFLDTDSETRSALLALRDLLQSGADGSSLAADQLARAARHLARDIEGQRLTRVATWSAPRYQVDTRFVELGLLVDCGEAAAAGRWQVSKDRFTGLGPMLEALDAPALVLLGAPGAGKSTLLRRLEMDLCCAGLRGEAASVTFFAELSGYMTESGEGPVTPRSWLASLWHRRHPQLPALDQFLDEGRVMLLLDGLNEIPHRGLGEYREHIGAWKRFIQAGIAGSGNRAIFSCRSLDYSAPLSTPELRLPQARVEALDDRRMRAFVEAYSGQRAAELWASIASSPQRDLLRRPYLLRLLLESAEPEAVALGGPAALLTAFVRRALRREVERDHPALAPGVAIAERDYLRIASAQSWRTAWELPERGPLVAGLERLAYSMQSEQGSEDGRAIRLPYDEALDCIGGDRAEAVVAAGLALAILDEDRDQDELMFFHQLIQEYFAARQLLQQPELALERSPWRAEEMAPRLAQLIEALGPGEPLPPLPGSSWGESCLMAADMTPEPERFIAALSEIDLVLAGRAAAQPELSGSLSPEMLAGLRRDLAARSRDPEADLRARFAAGRVLGQLGDPRFESHQGRLGDYRLPPLVEIEGGCYTIGDDQRVQWKDQHDTDHAPAHRLDLAPFAIGRFAVTNAEWACFIQAGGYEDPCWWEGEPAKAWRRGEGSDDDARQNNREWRQHFRAQPERIEHFLSLGTFDEATAERWRCWATVDDATFERELADRWPGRRLTEPRFWQDPRFNHPGDPVVGICWYEARAYCRWLAEQSGLAFRLPSEVEWEATARGLEARAFPYGERYRPLAGNTADAHLFGPSPIGVFPESDSPEGVCDLSGNTWDWTSSAWSLKGVDEPPDYAYPYDPEDGREDIALPPETFRIARGGAWNGSPAGAFAVNRNPQRTRYRADDIGLRLALSR